MLHHLIRKVRTVLRYLRPSVADRRYLRKIDQAGQFDRKFYLASNPKLKPLFRKHPERHYIQLGEANGLCPNPRFSPRAYLFHNPDLDHPGIRPLLHYIETGQNESRMVLAPIGTSSPGAEDIPAITPEDAPPDSGGFAVVLHIYYPDFWPEIAPVLAAQTFHFDLYVTISNRAANEALPAEIKAQFPRAKIWTMPNHGRDIFPLIHLVNSGLLARYRAIAKLHSKKSPHLADGDAWRHNLIRGILAEPGKTKARLTGFLADDKAAFWVSDGQIFQGDEWWGANKTRAEALLARINVRAASDHPLSFPAGSIYWVKPGILKQLRALKLGPEDFEIEQALVDGTTPHAVERMMGCLAAAAGQSILQTCDLDAARSHGTISDAKSRPAPGLTKSHAKPALKPASTAKTCSKICIHVGTHKTATTYIQALFENNKRLLGQHSIVLPKVPFGQRQHGLVGVWNNKFAPSREAALEQWQNIASDYANAGKTVFISSEEFSRMRPATAKTDMAELRALVAGFDEVILLCCFRNQAGFLQSIYQQLSMTRGGRPWDSFYETALETGVCHGLSLDYNRLYSHFLTGFARTEIRLMSYDLETRQPGGITAAVLRELGSDLPAGDLRPISKGKSNISLPPLISFLAKDIITPHSANPDLLRQIEARVIAQFGPRARTTVFTRDEVRRMEEKFATSNALLSDRIKPYQPEFTIAPMLPDGADVYRDQLTDA